MESWRHKGRIPLYISTQFDTNAAKCKKIPGWEPRSTIRDGRDDEQKTGDFVDFRWHPCGGNASPSARRGDRARSGGTLPPLSRVRRQPGPPVQDKFPFPKKLLDMMRQSGITAMKTTLGGIDGSFEATIEDIAFVQSLVEKYPDLYLQVRTHDDFARAKRENRTGILLSFDRLAES